MDTDDAHRSFINLLSKISVGRGGVGAGGTGSVVLSSSRPAPYVPEDLVAQAQSVLQGNLLIFFNSLNTCFFIHFNLLILLDKCKQTYP